MKHFLDIENKVWNSAKDGTIRAFSTDSEIPVTVYLQWVEGGWNRIYEVRIGAINSGSENRELAEEVFGAESNPSGWSVADITEFESSFAKSTLKPKSPFFSSIPFEFLERIPTLVKSLQRDIEGTRQVVQLLRSEYPLAGVGNLNVYWQDSEDNERKVVAYKLRELLRQQDIHENIEKAQELLNFTKNGKPISRSTFIRWSNIGGNIVKRQTRNKGVKK